MPMLLRPALLKRLDATLGLLLCKATGYLRHVAGMPELAPDPDPAAIRRILLIRPGGMGDMLMLLPVIRALRDARPDIAIDILCEKRNHEVLQLAGLDAGAILYDVHPLRVLGLRRRHYDLVLDTEQFHHFSALMGLWSGAPVRVGFRLNPARLSLYTHLVSYDVDGHELAQFARLLRPLGVSLGAGALDGILTGVTPPLAARPPAEVERLRHTRPFVALSPGSSDPYKQWGPARFGALIEGLVTRGLGVALVGGPSERRQAESLCKAAPADVVVNAVGRCSLLQTAAILQAATLFVGGDSGLAHLATALGRPTVVLFGPSDPRKWSQPGPRHIVLRHPLPCSPCSIFGYRKRCRTVACMAAIDVPSVLAAVDQHRTAASV